MNKVEFADLFREYKDGVKKVSVATNSKIKIVNSNLAHFNLIHSYPCMKEDGYSLKEKLAENGTFSRTDKNVFIMESGVTTITLNIFDENVQLDAWNSISRNEFNLETINVLGNKVALELDNCIRKIADICSLDSFDDQLPEPEIEFNECQNNEELNKLFMAYQKGVSKVNIVAETSMKIVSTDLANIHLKYKYLSAPAHLKKLKERISKIAEQLDEKTFRLESGNTSIKMAMEPLGVLFDAWNSMTSDEFTLEGAEELGMNVALEVQKGVIRLKSG